MGLAFSTFAHEGDLHRTAVFRSEVHMALSFGREAVSPVASRQDYLTKLKGISGCGIWQVGDRMESGLKARTGDTVTLIGIQHTWYPDLNYVQATRIADPLAL